MRGVRAWALATATVLAAGFGTVAPNGAAQAATTVSNPLYAVRSGWTPRPIQYPGTVLRQNFPITMSDGVRLNADLVLPADASGQAVRGRFPVIVTLTAYNAGLGFVGAKVGASDAYLVQRGYARLIVDVRGTGDSGGSWCAFCTREDRDGAEVLNWAHVQPWSNGSSGMSGGSYLAISQMFAAAGHPAGLKAIFPMAPSADTYRDVVASGGQIDTGFIPLWLGLVNGTALIPPQTNTLSPDAVASLIGRITGDALFTVGTVATALTGGEAAYSDFYAQRSPINVANNVNVPAFFVSGEYDIFQRGTPLLFENLLNRGVPTKLVVGPWTHTTGAAGGDHLADAGMGTLDELQLRWFDRYVRGVADPSLNSDIPPLTYYEIGSGTWRHAPNWMRTGHTAISYALSGSTQQGTTGVLAAGAGATGSSTLLPLPGQGTCTRSTNQWTAGALDALWSQIPCGTTNQWNDKLGLAYETAPLAKAVSFQGPINAHLYVSSTSGSGLLAVAVEDVAPDGTVNRLTGGWQQINMRALDTARSRYLNGVLIQPYHPFTQASIAPLTGVEPVDVEIFPTGAVIAPGHRLRISIQGFDMPHLTPTIPQLLGQATLLTIMAGPQYPSVITLPAVP